MPDLDELAERLRQLALSLPETYEDEPWGHPVFKVGENRMFAAMSFADECVRLTVKLTPEEREIAHLLPYVSTAAYVGRYGWVTAEVADDESLENAREWLLESYWLKAPPHLRSAVEGEEVRRRADPEDLTELLPGLFRWTAIHPEAPPASEPGSPGDWGPYVASTAYAAPDALVLVDPLVPGDRPELQKALDGLVAAHGQRVAILTTLGFHRRSRDELAERYGASTSRARKGLPKGVETIRIAGAGETMVWLPEPRALVPGDRLLGDDEGGLRLCPDSWLRYLPSGMGQAELREALRPLLDLPVELVLVAHGEPVLVGGRKAIARALSA